MRDNVTQVLRRTSDEGLLKAFATLTHQLHATVEVEQGEDIRAQRDRVQAEILRRMKSHGT